MRWPWSKPENARGRSAGTPQIISALIEAQASGGDGPTSFGDGRDRGFCRGSEPRVHGR